ncbi:DUF4186 domain-containing protein [Candidatus Omnitrophota bacterium]
MLTENKRTRDTLDRLAKSKFRSSFKLNSQDVNYIKRIGFEKIESHARDFVLKRLAPENPKNDGRQTPFKGHPVFKAQHATASCCRDCLSKWHKILEGRSLAPDEVEYIVMLVMEWIKNKLKFSTL